ncbi:hypothetical protein [Pantoea brenneri]|uniref:hypothetical protein n=1 Tax=Pantoea brenneri TaxID=472694 RepID=UPI0028A1EA45|nr:hypothetical protein [Pantoea brenneri]
MAEDSTKISSIVALHVVLALVLLFGQNRSQVLISILAVRLHASQHRAAPDETGFRLRKILKARAREEKASIRAGKRQSAK